METAVLQSSKFKSSILRMRNCCVHQTLNCISLPSKLVSSVIVVCYNEFCKVTVVVKMAMWRKLSLRRFQHDVKANGHPRRRDDELLTARQMDEILKETKIKSKQFHAKVWLCKVLHFCKMERIRCQKTMYNQLNASSYNYYCKLISKLDNR